MERNPNEGLVITVHTAEAQHGVVHAEPCTCHEYIQIGAENKQVLAVIEKFLGDLASQHNCIFVGCIECVWEGYIGPGDKAADEGNKAVVDEGTCPQCDGDLVNLEQVDCDHDMTALEPFYDEEDITDGA